MDTAEDLYSSSLKNPRHMLFSHAKHFLPFRKDLELVSHQVKILEAGQIAETVWDFRQHVTGENHELCEPKKPA